jgi:hypothetical protein
MLYRPLLVVRRYPFVVSGPVEAGGLLGVFCAFGRLLGVLRSLFAHGTSFVLALFDVRTSRPREKSLPSEKGRAYGSRRGRFGRTGTSALGATSRVRQVPSSVSRDL